MKIHKQADTLLEDLSGDHRVFIQGSAATPHLLIDALIKKVDSVGYIEIVHLHTHGIPKYAKKEYKSKFKVTNLFVGDNMRGYMDYSHVDYLPCFLSEIPNLLCTTRKVDVAFIHVSPPDKHGYCTLGTSVDVTKAAVDAAHIVVAQINTEMPRVHGDGFIHIKQIDHAIEISTPLDEHFPPELSDTEIEIGKNVAELIEDGATLQTGIGTIPDAVCRALHGHKDLGLHTEMWSDGMLDLIEKGIVNNSKKDIHRYKSISSFVMGTKKLFDFIHENPAVVQLSAEYINNPNVIRRNNKVIAINSAVEVDLTGQVCADSVGHKIISGVGGQMDFMRGASLSEGGKPIIAIPSRTRKKRSKITMTLAPGAGVVTTRAHIHYVVTEYGSVNLYGKTLGERAKDLISIAHPDDREGLSKQWYDFSNFH